MYKILLLFIFPLTVFCQDVNRSLNIKKSTSKIIVDGVLDEADWQIAQYADSFYMKFPTNDTKTDVRTEVKLTYDGSKLYIAVKAYEEKPGFVLSSLKRDIGLREGDGVGIVLDPVNFKSNGFYFSVSPYNTQTEGLIGAGFDDISFTWDNKWYTQTKVYDGYWTAEIAIPFSILRYDDTKKIWGINFIRSNRKANEFYTWTQVPLQFRGFDLGYLGSLIWDNNPPKSGKNYVINPYVTGSVTYSKEDNKPTKFKPNAGFDAKVGVTSSLNLDLTVNPDFSQVDVDQQVTNLTRFNIFFPERRVFFLENDDLFSSYGIPPIRPFYSRRIGSKGGTNVPIFFGARLSGNIAKSTRIGVMNVQTGRKGDLAADNFTAISVNQRVLDRSVVKGYVINRNAFMSEEEARANPLGKYGRNGGIELNYSNKEGTINAWGGSHFSSKPEINGQNIYLNGGLGYFGSKFSSFIDYEKVGKNYYTDLGFVNRVSNYDALRDTVIRQGFTTYYNETSYQWNLGRKGFLNRIKLSSENFLAYDEKNKFNELQANPTLAIDFKNSSSLNVYLSYNKLNLLFPFKFVDDIDALPLEAKSYEYASYGVKYNSDRRKNLIYNLTYEIGKFYNANYSKYNVELIGRNQPYLSLGLNFEYNQLQFPTAYGGKQDFLLIAPRIEWNLSNALFWTSFLQYNTQAKNFNINSRIQWRYSPMSDLFLVYSDDYLTGNALSNKSRGVVLKINYWI